MSSSDVPPKVLVVGAGPAGLVFALALLQNGIPVRIIEKELTPRIGQRGAGIMPRSLELFTTLGVVDEVLKSAIPTPPVCVYELPGGIDPKHEFEMAPITDPTPACPFLNIIVLGQNHLEQILRAALAKYSCQVELGTELTSFKQERDHVQVDLIKHEVSTERGTLETSNYDWVIGTDGARGITRKQLGLSFLGETRSVENLVVGDIYVEGLSNQRWHMWGDASTTLVSLRPTEVPTIFNAIIAGRHVDHSRLSSDEEAFRNFLSENTGHRSDLKFTKISWLSLYTPNIRMVEKFGQGRVFLAGDSAHVHSPLGAQGMNTSIQDSFNLAWKLALVQRNLAPYALINTYTEERLPVVAELLARTTKILTKTFGNDKPEDSWNRTGSILQLGVNYRWSSIVIDERKQAQIRIFGDGDLVNHDFEEKREAEIMDTDPYGVRSDGILRAGDRAPDAPGLVLLSTTLQTQSVPQRLFNVFGPSYHTILIFDQASSQCKFILDALSACPAGTVRSAVIVGPENFPTDESTGSDLVLEDRDGHAHRVYATVEKYGVVIVRPDGVIGAIVGEREGLVQYFEKIFGR